MNPRLKHEFLHGWKHKRDYEKAEAFFWCVNIAMMVSFLGLVLWAFVSVTL